MTQQQSQQIAGNRREAEQLWNVSLLPVAALPRSASPAPQAIVFELPLEKTQRPTLQRNAA
jgi:hypothetical protein